MTSRRAALILAIVLLALQAVAIVQRADRQAHKDEAEYLHAAWLMSHGEQLYVSFFEHHPPFLFAALQLVAGDDIPSFFVRARLFAGAFALVALSAFAAIVWQMRPEAAPIALALLFASQPLWMDGLVAARVEPFAMAFFWSGAALVLLSGAADSQSADGSGGLRAHRSTLTGIGIGLVMIAGLWTPKWPFSSAVVAAFWFFRTPRRLRSAAVGLAMCAAGLLALRLFAPLEQLWFFNIEFNRAFWPMLARSPEVLERDLLGGVPFLYAPSLLRPLVMAVAFAFGAVLHRNLLVRFFLLLACAAALELRFIFPYPALWPHYYLMWAFAATALIGVIPASVETLLRRVKSARLIGYAVAAILALLAAAHLIATAPLGTRSDDGPYWVSQRFFKKHLRPGETVWVDVSRHPVGVRDADYYWFGFGFVSEELRRTPRGARFLPPRRDPPFCALTRGATTNLRFVSAPRRIEVSQHEQRCFEQLIATGRVRLTPVSGVYEIVR